MLGSLQKHLLPIVKCTRDMKQHYTILIVNHSVCIGLGTIRRIGNVSLLLAKFSSQTSDGRVS